MAICRLHEGVISVVHGGRTQSPCCPRSSRPARRRSHPCAASPSPPWKTSSSRILRTILCKACTAMRRTSSYRVRIVMCLTLRKCTISTQRVSLLRGATPSTGYTADKSSHLLHHWPAHLRDLRDNPRQPQPGHHIAPRTDPPTTTTPLHQALMGPRFQVAKMGWAECPVALLWAPLVKSATERVRACIRSPGVRSSKDA
jgi:hypothetical protein